MVIDIPQGFERIGRILQDAVDQLAGGKGVKRHGTRPDGAPIPFADQQMLRNARICGPGGPANQVLKKTEEALLLHAQGDQAGAYIEILGGINALAAMGDVIQPARGSLGDESEEHCP